MKEAKQDSESLHRQNEFYKRRIEELAGDNLKYDISVSGLRHELRQRRKSFALLSQLQQKTSEQTELSSLFEVTIQAINPTLGMDKTLVLKPTEKEHIYRPEQWQGFQQQETENFLSLSLKFPEEFAEGNGLLLVNKSTEPTPLIEEIRSFFDLPFFICLPVMFENAPIGLLLSGRLKEAKPFYPPLEQGDVDTFQAIADLITATVRNRRLTVLKEMDRLKTDFFANISHEFRTPITLTLGPLDQMLKGRYGDLSNDLRKQLRIVQHNQGRLLGLINQILDLSKLESGKMQLKAALAPDLNQFIEDRVDQFRSAARERGIEMEVSTDPDVRDAAIYIDREQFDKVLYNLLSNALKFTKQGTIKLKTSISGEMFRMEISDTGIGIKKDQTLFIFDRFRQADGSESREQAGTGLGLALVQEIIKMHGGEITVHSQYQKGTTFHLEIPLGKDHLEQSSIVEYVEDEQTDFRYSPKALIFREDTADNDAVNEYNQKIEKFYDSGKSTVLYVEDNSDLRSHVQQLLSNDYNVFLAVDGQDGLSKTRKYKPDLILTDQMMPHMTGRDLLRAIRKDPELNNTPVIFLTARTGNEARIESLDKGANDYIAKPFDEEELKIRIKNMISLFSQQRELLELNLKLESKVEEQMAQLELAARIQEDLLPKEAPSLNGYEIVGKNLPSKIVGGDYFDFIQLNDHQTAICLGDVCGKGLPASLLMANLQATVRGQAHFSTDTKQCLERSNKLLYHSTDNKTFVSLFYGILDKQNHTLHYSNAGQNLPLIFSPNKSPVPLKVSNLVLGVVKDKTYDDEKIYIKKGDLLVIYSDGVSEAMDDKQEEFGEQRLMEIVTLYKNASADELMDRILSAVDLFTRGTPQSDDMTLVLIKRK